MRNRNFIAGRIFIIIILAAILFLAIPGGIAAGVCSDSTQRIMRLSSANNAHAEIWSKTNYGYEICYNEIFGSAYAGSNPQTCTGSNKVVKLSAETNAHAEAPTSSTYATDVCYGNLVCAARSSCLSDEKEVVSLSSETNAHLASDGSYSTKICCKSSTIITPPPTEVCNDGLDNDGNGEQDYDYTYTLSMHGDSACPLSVTAISVSDSNPIENTNIEVSCTSSVAGVNSIDAYIDSEFCTIEVCRRDSVLCTWDSWTGDVASFTCNVGSYLGGYTSSAKTAKCTVNAEKSYQSGTDKTAAINVQQSACSAYASSSSCESNSACDWCGKCSGTKYNNLDGDRCVSAGSCSYSCWKDKCGAGCDETNGGWTNYVCDSYCSGNTLYARSDVSNSCQDNCMPTANTCDTGTATSCGATTCALGIGSCNNPCAEAGTSTDGTDAACGTCTPTCTAITSVNWNNLNNQVIQSSQKEDSARLTANGYEITGKNISFIIYKSGGGCGLLWLSDCEIAQSSTIAQSNSASITWKASEAGTLYFKARIVETGQEMQSGNLVVSSTEDNSAPVAVINSPANGARFEINTPISFTQSSYDEDDDISVSWNFDDGNTTTLTNCLTGGNCSTMHTFTSQGTKNVIITATDARGRTGTAFASIDIFRGGAGGDAINVFARISEPQPNQIIQGSGWVSFNASGSYAANCASPCIGVCYAVGSLQCINLNQNNLMFNWTFDDGTTRYGTWQSNYSYVVKFNKFFGAIGTHTATLKVGYP